MRKHFLLRGDYNVIQMDWSGGSQLPYTQATANTRLVGAEAALLIQFLEQNAGAKREDFHFIGHSLGSHIGGYTGERLGGKLGRITGLDPAGPFFEGTKPVVRLDPTDAMFVDAIHTDGNSVINAIKLDGGFGLMQPVGHVDFYPNGGQIQPDCSRNPITNIIIKGIIEGSKWTIACDHLRVLPLFTDTLLSYQCKFKAFPCDSYENFKAGKCNSCGETGCAYMGYHANSWEGRNKHKLVQMFLDTTGSEPFCEHPYFIKVDIGNGDKGRSVYGNVYVTLHGESGSSSELEFFEKKTTMKPDTSYSRAMLVTQNLGELKRVTFKWKYSKNILDPGGLIFSRYLHLKEVEVVDGSAENKSNYCGRQDALRSDSEKTMDKSDSC